MEPSYPTYNTEPVQNRPFLALLNVLIGGAVLVCILFLLLSVAGYGTVQLINIPSDATVLINGHQSTNTTIRLRAGDYQIVITSPRTAPLHDKLHIGLLRSITYEPVFKHRDPNAVASATLGAVNGSSSAPQLDQAQWLDGDAWLAGHLKPNGEILALHYDRDHKQWSVGFYKTQGYPSDTTKLPSDVVAYIEGASH